MTASFEGHDDIVRMLIEAKAQVNTQEKVHACTMYMYMYVAPRSTTMQKTHCTARITRCTM